MSLTLTRRHNVDRLGYLIPTRYGNVPMVGAVATYRPGEGRFGGAVAVEDGTTNLIPAEKTTFVGWTAIGGASVTLTQGLALGTITSDGATRIQTSGGTDAFKYSMRDVPTGRGGVDTECAWSVWVKNLSSNNLIVLTETDATPNRGREIVPPGKLIKYTRTITGRSTNYFRRITFAAEDPSHDLDFIAYQPQIESKPFPTSFVAGTREAGRLSYPVNFNMDEGTIRCCFYLNKTAVINSLAIYPTIFMVRQGAGDGNWLWVYFNEPRTLLRFQRRTDSGSTSGGYVDLSRFDELSNGWHDVAIVWDHTSGVIRVYLDGEFKGTATYDKNDLIPFDRIEVGYRQGTSGAGNLLFDELLILPYAASEEEIRSWYEADGPLPPHPDALLQWDWQAVRPATMVVL